MRKNSSIRLVITLLLVLLTALALTVFASAKNQVGIGFTGEVMYYYYDDNSLEIRGNGSMGNYEDSGTAPWYDLAHTFTSVIIGEGVTNIDEHAFDSFYNLKTITIPSTVFDIEKNAFNGCTSLQSIEVLGNNIHYASIDGVLYSGTTMDTLIHYPAGKADKSYYVFQFVKHIEDNAFFWASNLEEVTLCDGLISIGDYAFDMCESLKSIHIPSTVSEIGEGAFSWCYDLESITVGAQNTKYTAVNGVLYTKDMETLLLYPAKKAATSFTIPDTVKVIAADAFWCAENLTNVIFNESLETIGHGAFHASSITSFIPGDNLKEIGGGAFQNCMYLSTILLPDGIEKVGASAFYNTYYYSNESNWENNLLYIGKYLVDSKEVITSCDIKEGTRLIADMTFCFRENLSRVTLPDSLKIIGEGAFSSCESLPIIGLNQGLEVIGNFAFAACRQLRQIVIPESVKSIGDGAFMNSDNLKKATFEGDVPENIYNNLFENCNADFTVYYYEGKEGWSSPIWRGYASEAITVKVTGVTLDKSEATLTEGDTLSLSASVAPENASNKNVTWSSSNPAVATVTGGTVTAVSEGTAVITATTVDGGYTSSCTVTVNAQVGGGDDSGDDNGGDDNFDENSPTVTVSSLKATSGREVEISISIENNPGIAGYEITLNFDNTVLTPVSVANGDVFNGELTSNIHNGEDLSKFTFVTATYAKTTNTEKNGTLVTFKFKVKDDAPIGKTALTLDCKVTNQSLDDVSLNKVNGVIEVIDCIYGDINGDAEVDIKDAVLLAQRLAKWEVTIDEVAADVNVDGVIDIKDAVLLAQYLAKWDVTLGN